MEQTNDGFAIAEKDLEQTRVSFSSRQHGVPRAPNCGFIKAFADLQTVRKETDALLEKILILTRTRP